MSSLLNTIAQAAYDFETQAFSVEDTTHRMNHEGFMHHASGKVTGMLDAGVHDFLISVGASPAHLQNTDFSFGRGDIDVQIYEGTTTSADGSALSLFNTNRNSSKTPLTAVYTGPTVSAAGTLIHTAWIPPTATGTGLSANGFVQGGTGEEWELQPSTKYLVRLTNNSGATIDFRHEWLFYEIDF